jgi:hypothetical protein
LIAISEFERRMRTSVAPSTKIFELVIQGAGKTFLLVAWLIVTFAGTLRCQTNPLTTPWQQKTFPNLFSSGRTLPKIDNGYLISFRRTVATGPANDAIDLRSLTSDQEIQVPFWLNGASVIWIEDVGITPANNLLVVGAFVRAGDPSPSNFLAEVDPSGNTLSTTDSGSYSPVLVCGTNDGTIWTLGQDWSAESAGTSYAMLRNYSVSGQLLRSYMQRQTPLASPINLSARLHHTGGLPGRAYLQCGSGSVGAYIGPSRIWIEVQLSDKSSQIWRVQLPGVHSEINGLALLGDHVVYGSVVAANPDMAHQEEGLYQLNLSQARIAVWQPVAGTTESTSASGSLRALVGRDSASLVYVEKGTFSSDGNRTFFWAKP